MTFPVRPSRCLLLILLLSFLYFTPLWLNPQEILYADYSDFLATIYPWRYFVVSHWQAHHALPLWYSPGCAGQPFEADSQSQLFYPPYAVFYLAPAHWLAPLCSVLIWAHVLLAGVVMFLYARKRGLEPFAALVAAAGFMFGGKWLLHILQPGHHTFLPVAWFPLLLLWVEAAIERRSFRHALGAGVLSAVIFTGAHPQITLYIGFLAVLLSLRPVFNQNSLADDVTSDPPVLGSYRGRLGWWLLTWSVAGVLALGLTAIQLLPSLEMLPYLTRAHGMTADYSIGFDLVFHNVRELGKRLLSLLGTKSYGGNPWETVGAFGVLWSGTAVLALAWCRRPGVWFYGAVLLLLMLFACHSSTPVYPFLRRVVPGLALFRIPTRMLLLAGFPLGMLAGCLSQRLFGPRPVSRPALAGSGLFLAMLAGLYLKLTLRHETTWQPYGVCLAVIGPALVLVLLWRSWRPALAGWPALAWLLVLTADLWAIHGRFVRTRPVEEVYPDNDTVRFLAEHPGHYRVLDRYVPGQPDWYSTVTQAMCCRHDIEWVRGFGPSDLFSYRQYLNFVTDRDEPPDLNEVPLLPRVPNQQLLDLFAVRYLFGPAEVPLTPQEASCWKRIQTLGDNRVYTNGTLCYPGPIAVYERKAPLPRAFVVAQALAAPTERSAVLHALRGTDLSRTVFLDSPPSWSEEQVPPVLAPHGGPAFQEATVLSRQPNRIVVEVDRQEPGYLVLSDAWYPGWKCHTADGHRLPIWRADSFFRAVPVPAGRQRLVFVFAPRLYAIGKAISLGTLAFLLAIAAWSIGQGWLRKRRTLPASSDRALPADDGRLDETVEAA